MTCQEWELALGSELVTAETEAHLENCAECRALVAELRANSEAFRLMGEEALPPVMIRKPGRMPWAWIGLAAAAVIAVIAFGFAHQSPIATVPIPPVASLPGNAPEHAVSVPVRVARKRPTPRAVQTLKVKMFTSDPDVVIYWLVDKKEGIE